MFYFAERTLVIFISKKDISKLLGISYSTIYRWSVCGKMPKPISLGANKTVWVKEEILNWVDELKIHSRGFGKKKEGKNV